MASNGTAICPGCGRHVPAGPRIPFCNLCGAALPAGGKT